MPLNLTLRDRDSGFSFLVRNFVAQDDRFQNAFGILEKATAARAFPGCSLAVTFGGELVAHKALGRFTYDPASPEVTTASLFDLASLTKVLATTVMAMILYERGLLDLEAPVTAIVPEFAGQFADYDDHRRGITLRMLLAHSSGLPAYEKLFLRARTREDLLRAAFANPLAAGPGARADYSDIGFIVLGVVLERLADQGYQYCIVDPEGDYALLENTIVLGDKERAPTVAGALEVLEQPNRNVVVNLLGLGLDERPAFFARLLPGLQDLRSRTGRPHWIVVDEAHHLLPAPSDLVSVTLPRTLSGMLLITVHPEHVAPAVLSSIDVVVGIGRSAGETLRAFSDAVEAHLPPNLPSITGPGEAILWRRRPEARDPVWIRTFPPKAEHRRHVRKYATGELGEDRSFYFRGPAGQLNLRAQNLGVFMQLADGVDDETWLHHLRQQDYSRWFREAIKDEDLAAEAAAVETQPGLSPKESRELIKAAIERRYTMPS